MSSTGIYKDKE